MADKAVMLSGKSFVEETTEPKESWAYIKTN